MRTGIGGRALAAIQRMVPTHTRMTLAGIDGWNATVDETGEGVVLTVVAHEPGEVPHIRGLGFLGLMATGSQPPTHHLMLASGEMTMDHGAG